MATYSYSFATALTGMHFATTTLMTFFLKWLGHIQNSQLPWSERLKFVLFANFSTVGMNVSLMWNSVGFYQIAKLSMIPVSCFLEIVLDNVRYSSDTKLSILLVLLGVGICVVTDVSVNTKGFVAAFIAVWSIALQQYIKLGVPGWKERYYEEKFSARTPEEMEEVRKDIDEDDSDESEEEVLRRSFVMAFALHRSKAAGNTYVSKQLQRTSVHRLLR